MMKYKNMKKKEGINLFYLYKKSKSGDTTNFVRLQKVSLAGCKSGLIVAYIRKVLDRFADEPLKWSFSNKQMFDKLFLDGNALIIDAKPHSEKEILLFEIVNISGFSHHGWTPILLELREVLVDEDPQKYNRMNFSLQGHNPKNPVFNMLYLKGTVKNGQIKGDWNFPGPSPTNSVFLWPETLAFFASQMGLRKDIFRSIKPYLSFLE